MPFKKSRLRGQPRKGRPANNNFFFMMFAVAVVQFFCFCFFFLFVFLLICCLFCFCCCYFCCCYFFLLLFFCNLLFCYSLMQTFNKTSIAQNPTTRTSVDLGVFFLAMKKKTIITCNTITIQ